MARPKGSKNKAKKMGRPKKAGADSNVLKLVSIKQLTRQFQKDLMKILKSKA